MNPPPANARRRLMSCLIRETEVAVGDETHTLNTYSTCSLTCYVSSLNFNLKYNTYKGHPGSRMRLTHRRLSHLKLRGGSKSKQTQVPSLLARTGNIRFQSLPMKVKPTTNNGSSYMCVFEACHERGAPRLVPTLPRLRTSFVSSKIWP